MNLSQLKHIIKEELKRLKEEKPPKQMDDPEDAGQQPKFKKPPDSPHDAGQQPKFTVTPQGGRPYIVDKNHKEYGTILSKAKSGRPISKIPSPMGVNHPCGSNGCCNFESKIFNITWKACCDTKWMSWYC